MSKFRNSIGTARRSLTAWATALALASAFSAQSAAAQQYTAIKLNPKGFTGSEARGASGGQQAGGGTVTSSGQTYTRALLWFGSAASAVNLHPAGFTHSFALATDGARQVGYGGGSTPDSEHALLWSGSAGSVVDLHPAAGFTFSSAYGIHGPWQVGYGYSPSSGTFHALLWSGTASSVVDLHPALPDVEEVSDRNSVAHAVYGYQQVGWSDLFLSSATGGEDKELVRHAMLWSGTALSAVDLNPIGFDGSVAYGIYGIPGTPAGTQQVGWGFKRQPNIYLYPQPPGPPQNIFSISYLIAYPGYWISYVRNFQSPQFSFGVYRGTHALLWKGTAASAVDLHPAGLASSVAVATNGTWQVGFGSAFLGDCCDHALLWAGSASSYVDLHYFLPAGYTHSYATGIDQAGNVVGYAFNGSTTHAFMWRRNY